MYALAFLSFTAFVWALLLTPVVRRLACRFGLVDVPDSNRRIHRAPVPRMGGVIIVMAYAAAFGVLFALNFTTGELIRDALPYVERLLPAALVIFLTGLLDDLVGLKPWEKFAGQVLSAVLAIWAGVAVNGVAGYEFTPWLSLPLTVLWLVGCANAFNLIDGVDGLAAGIGLFATATMLVAALTQKNIAFALAVAPLAGALLGFLRYNFNPATIFLGDSGSLTVGFLLGCFGVLWGQKAATALGLTAPLMALAVPLADTALAIARRWLRGRPIFTADRGHIHHRLLDRGLTPRRVALLLYGVAALGALFSVAQSVFQRHFGGAVVVLFCLSAWLGIQSLGYVEFDIFGRMFTGGAFRRHLNAQLALRTFESDLRAALRVEDCWTAIERAAKEFGYDQVRARLSGRVFERLNGAGSRPDWNYWTIRIPLTETDFVNLDRFAEATVPLAHVGAFADSIQRNVSERLNHLDNLRRRAATTFEQARQLNAPSGAGQAPRVPPIPLERKSPFIEEPTPSGVQPF